MNSLLHDVRYALRVCLRTPAFTLVAVSALALGIGANTAIFTIVHAVLLEPLPYPDPDRLVVVWEQSARRPGHPNTVAPANFLQWRDRATAFEHLAAFADIRANLAGRGEPEELVVQMVTPEFFHTLGIEPLRGRVFTASEGVPRTRTENNVAILSYELWQRRFGGDAAVLGRPMQLDGNAVTVVGVMPPGFGLFLKAGSLVGKAADAWLPMRFDAGDREPRGRYLSAIARLKRGVSLGEAQAQMDTIARALTAQWPRFDAGWSVRLVQMHAELSGELKPALLVLMGAVAFVLLIACANVANLLLARGAGRRRELAIRTALGAGRGQLVRLLLIEALTLAALGGLAGLLIAQWGVDLLVAFSPVDLTALGHLTVSYAVLAFAAGVSICTAVVCGIVPAFEAARHDTHSGLKEGAREAGSGRRGRRLREAFVVCEVALALALLFAAGLLLRSFVTLRAVDPGFHANNVLTARMAVTRAKYEEDWRRTRFFRDVVGRVSALPGVRAAGVVSFLPFAGLGAATDFTIEGHPVPPPGQEPVVDVRVCDNGYFSAMQIPLVRGRLFSAREMEQQSNVVIVSASLARQYFPNQDPMGRRLLIDMTDPLVPTTIIGVVGDVHDVNLVTAPRAAAYWPSPQLPYGAMTLVVRTDGQAASLLPAIRREVFGIDADQPLSDVRTMDEWVGRSLARTRFVWMLLAVFAGIAVLLASMGIYGVMSHAVSQRTGEIGVRMALGAVRRDILAMVVASSLRLTALGVGMGTLLALSLRRVLTALLYGTAGADAVTLMCTIAILAAVSMLASYLPARRAVSIPPAQALRDQ